MERLGFGLVHQVGSELGDRLFQAGNVVAQLVSESLRNVPFGISSIEGLFRIQQFPLQSFVFTHKSFLVRLMDVASSSQLREFGFELRDLSFILEGLLLEARPLILSQVDAVAKRMQPILELRNFEFCDRIK